MANIFTVSTPFGGPATSFSPRRSGALGRLVAAIVRSRQLRADREIAEILTRRGGLLPHEVWHGREAARLTYPFGHTRAAQQRS